MVRASLRRVVLSLRRAGGLLVIVRPARKGAGEVFDLPGHRVEPLMDDLGTVLRQRLDRVEGPGACDMQGRAGMILHKGLGRVERDTLGQRPPLLAWPGILGWPVRSRAFA
jgi:hypothetical protein